MCVRVTRCLVIATATSSSHSWVIVTYLSDSFGVCFQEACRAAFSRTNCTVGQHRYLHSTDINFPPHIPEKDGATVSRIGGAFGLAWQNFTVSPLQINHVLDWDYQSNNNNALW